MFKEKENQIVEKDQIALSSREIEQYF